MGHFERCAAVVAKKDVVEPLKPLEPQEQALLLAESASLSVILKHKPLGTVQANSPVAVVFPFKRESPAIDIEQLRSYRERVASKEKLNSSSGSGEDNKENRSTKRTDEENVQSSKENSTAKQNSSIKDFVINRRSFSKTSTSPNQTSQTTSVMRENKEKGIPSPKKSNLNSSLQKRSCGSEEKKMQGSKLAVPKVRVFNFSALLTLCVFHLSFHSIFQHSSIEGVMAQWRNPLTLKPEQSCGVGSIPGRTPPLERHDN